MISYFVENEKYVEFDSVIYKEKINDNTAPVLNKFKKLIKFYVYFNVLFVFLLLIEMGGFLLLLPHLADSSLLSFALALIFLTCFSFLILRFYLQSAKPEKIAALKDEYIRQCNKNSDFYEGAPHHHAALAKAYSKFSEILAGKEFTYYRPPLCLRFLTSPLDSFSYWWHWHDVHSLREELLLASIEEHLQLVRCEPTSLEVHAALANAYILLANLYSALRQEFVEGNRLWQTDDKYVSILDNKFRDSSQSAIEEFKILSEYAPHEPWAHLQLAYSYHDLNMPMEEIRAYETILQLTPDDFDTLFKLGSLYFQQGMNVQGLRVYEELKLHHYKKAETLIQLYGKKKNSEHAGRSKKDDDDT